METVFKIMAAGLVLALIDQIFMISKYSNISKETVFVIFCLMFLSLHFSLFDEKKNQA